MHADADRHQRISQLFIEAAGLPEAERSAFLDRACGDDGALRADVEALLAHDSDNRAFLDTPVDPAAVRDAIADASAAGASPPPSNALNHPEHIGRFRIVRVIGEGGMGVVYEAEQDHPHRTVALKVIRTGIASPSLLRRFELEAEALGRLQHPGIAQIYEAGTFDTGRGEQPFFAMEYIQGLPLPAFADRHSLDTRSRLQLVMQICDAVAHAHQRGVIHRDLKPANIIVEESDTSSGSGSRDTRTASAPGRVKILDFGVARLTDGDMTVATQATDIGQLVGTLPYMSPEQVVGDPDAIDTRCDVYALGVVCYELLSGRTPFDLTGRMLHEAARIIREDEPTPLSTLDRQYRGDLETIVIKALAKEPSRRYDTASALADDIQRYLNDEPILAQPASAGYHLRKFARRHKSLVIGAAAVLLTLIAGIVGTSIGMARAMHANARAQQREQEAIAAQDAEAEHRLLAEQHARDLRRVTEFQAMLLYDISPEAMGREIFDDLRSQLTAAWERAGLDQPAIAERLATSDRLLRSANPSNLARRLIHETILAHADERITRDFADAPRLEADLRRTLGGAYEQLGLYEQMLAQTERSFEIIRNLTDDTDPEYAYTLYSVGTAQYFLGRYDEAERTMRRAIDLYDRIVDPDDPDRLVAMNRLALILDRQGKYDAALERYQYILDARTRALGRDAPETAGAMHNLAGLLVEFRRFDEAESLFQAALDARSRALGPDHADTISTRNQYALLRFRRGDYTDAEHHWRIALEARRRLLGDLHPQTLATASALGTVLSSLDRLDEAEPLLREGMDGRRALFGDAHPEVLNSMHNYASFLRKVGRHDEALPIIIDTWHAAQSVFGPQHPNTLAVLRQLGPTYEQLDQFDEAEAHFRQALAMTEAALGPEHSRTCATHNGLAQFFSRRGRFDDALTHAQRALDCALAAHGEQHPDTIALINNLADVYDSLDRLDDAQTHYARAHALYLEQLGPDHEFTLIAQLNLARNHQKRSDFEHAATLYRDVIELAERTLGETSRMRGVCLVELGACLLDLDRADEALAMLTDGYPIIVAAFGESSGRAARVRSDLALACDALGRGDDAARWRAPADDQ